MATAKKEKAEETKVEEKVVTPETGTPTQEDTKKKEPAKKEKAEETKVYKFTSANKFLSCNGLGVQFINGEATTTKLEVAKALVKIDGVELVENE